MLTNKNKKQLKALANSSSHKYQIGKGAVDASVVDLLNNALKAHELIKVNFNRSVASETKKITDEIIVKTKSELVTTIGHSIVLYKANPEKKNRIILN